MFRHIVLGNDQISICKGCQLIPASQPLPYDSRLPWASWTAAHNILQYMQVIRHILKVRSSFARGANFSTRMAVLTLGFLDGDT